MEFKVLDIVNIQSLEGCRVLAGKAGVNRSIRSVSIMDAPDTSWLKRGDLLLTTGYIFKDNEDAQIQLINNLAERDCAGLAIKVKRFLSGIPESMLKEADRLGLPLIELPYDIVLSDMLISLTWEIVDKEDRFNRDENRNSYLASLFRNDLIDKDNIRTKSKQFELNPNLDFAVLYIAIYSEQKNESPIISLPAFLSIVNETGRKVNAKLNGVQVLKDLSVIIQVQKGNLELPALAKKVASLLEIQLAKLLPNNRFQIGIGTRKSDIENINKSYNEAKQAIFIGERLSPGGAGTIFEYTGYEPEALLQHLPENILKEYVDGTLESLSRYDQENGTELLATLEAYMNCGGKLADTANHLYLHRNTVKFRIGRIEELLSIDLNDSKEVFRLQLGIRIARLLGLVEGHPESFIHTSKKG